MYIMENKNKYIAKRKYVFMRGEVGSHEVDVNDSERHEWRR